MIGQGFGNCVIDYYITTTFQWHKSMIRGSPDPFPIFEGGVRLRQTTRARGRLYCFRCACVKMIGQGFGKGQYAPRVCTLVLFINPRRACAARVTVVVLCVCLCVCVCLSPLILALQAPNRLMSDTNGSSATSARKIMWRFR